MLSVGVKELKNHLSRYLGRVKQGEDLLVTERGKVIARIIREDRKKTSVVEALIPLVAEGVVTLPSQKLSRQIPEPIQLAGKPLSEIALEDRR
jgi:prevent-host-death family protein